MNLRGKKQVIAAVQLLCLVVFFVMSLACSNSNTASSGVGLVGGIAGSAVTSGGENAPADLGPSDGGN